MVYALNRFLGANLHSWLFYVLSVVALIADVRLLVRFVKFDRILVTVLFIFGLVHLLFYYF